MKRIADPFTHTARAEVVGMAGLDKVLAESRSETAS